MTHPRDAETRPQLYKVNKVPVEDMIENLTIMFSDEGDAQNGVLFPTEDEIMNLLQDKQQLESVAGESCTDNQQKGRNLSPNQPVAVIWDKKARKEWYIGFFLDKNEDGTYRIDHLQRKIDKSSLDWVRPSGYDDIQDTEEVQILPVEISADWNFNSVKPEYVLNNLIEIQKTFDLIVSELFQ